WTRRWTQPRRCGAAFRVSRRLVAKVIAPAAWSLLDHHVAAGEHKQTARLSPDSPKGPATRALYRDEARRCRPGSHRPASHGAVCQLRGLLAPELAPLALVIRDDRE